MCNGYGKEKNSIYRQITQLSLPILLGMIAELLYSLADMYFIALIDKGSTANISGVGIIFPLVFLLTSIDQGIGSGIATITAIAYGAKKHEVVKETARTGHNLSLYSGLVLVCFFFIFSKPIITLLSGNNISIHAQEVAGIYLRYCLPGFLFMFLVQARFSTLQGIGKTKVIGVAMAGSTILNIVLDPIFIFTLNMGVKGAAVSTVVTQIVLYLFVSYQFSMTKITENKISDCLKLDTKILKRIIKIGIPASLSFIILSVSFMLLNKAVSNINEISLNSYTLVTRLDGILVTPALAFSIGLSIIIGQNYGAGNLKELKNIFRKGTVLITLITISIGFLYMILAKQIFMAMSSNSEVVKLATKQVLLLTTPVAIGMSVAISASRCLQALQKPTKAMLVTGFRSLFLTAPLIVIFNNIMTPCIYNIWWAVLLGLFSGSIIGIIYIRKSMKELSKSLN